MFAILRTKRIKDNDAVGKAFSHNLRTKFSNNVDKSKSNQNEILIDDLDFKNADSYSEVLNNYYRRLEAKEKNNSVKMLEMVLTASPDFFESATPGQKNEWKKAQIEFAKKEFGDNLKFAVMHNDEKTPHIHLMISIEEKKQIKFKNRYGSGEKTQVSLNARRFNREYLKDLQTRYAEHNKRFGLIRGLRNSKATHKTLKEFANAVNVSLEKDYSGLIRKQISKVLQQNKNALGYIKASDLPELIAPFINQLMKANKILKTHVAFNSLENIQEMKELLSKKEEINKLRDEYFQAVKDSRQKDRTINSLQKENQDLKKELSDLKEQAQKKNSVNVDKSRKIS